ISGLAGDDIIFGGVNRDTINAGGGNNIVLGDHGIVDFIVADGNNQDIDLIKTIDPDFGGSDTITAGSGDDIIFGGEDGEIVRNDIWSNPTNITRTVDTDPTDGD